MNAFDKGRIEGLRAAEMILTDMAAANDATAGSHPYHKMAAVSRFAIGRLAKIDSEIKRIKLESESDDEVH